MEYLLKEFDNIWDGQGSVYHVKVSEEFGVRMLSLYAKGNDSLFISPTRITPSLVGDLPQWYKPFSEVDELLAILSDACKFNSGLEVNL